MKKKIMLVGFVGLSILLTACGEPDLTPSQKFEMDKLRLTQQHELDMARVQSPVVQQVAPQQEVQQNGQGNWDEHTQTPVSDEYNDVGYGSGSNEPSSSGSSVLGTVAAVGAGALAGYAVSELLDDGHRSYTDSNGRTRYVNGSGKEISNSQYDAYKKKHPTKHKLSQYNQKGKTAVATAKNKTVTTATKAKKGAVTHWQTAKKKVQKATKQKPSYKTKSYSRPTSKKRR